MLQLFSSGVWIRTKQSSLCRLQLSELSCVPGLSKLSMLWSPASAASAFLQFWCESSATQIFTWSKGAISTESHHLCYKSWTVMQIGNFDSSFIDCISKVQFLEDTTETSSVVFSLFGPSMHGSPRTSMLRKLAWRLAQTKRSESVTDHNPLNCSLNLFPPKKKKNKHKFSL